MLNRFPKIKKIVARNYFIAQNYLFEIKCFLRKNKIDKSYDEFKKLKNTHVGERCFILATGPSLTIEDMEKLKNEFTFSMNSIYLTATKTSWRPDVLAVQDIRVYKNNKKDLDKYCMSEKNMKVLISDNIYKKVDVPAEYIKFPLYYSDHLYTTNSNNVNFSIDCFDRVHDGFSVTYSLIQIAVYMGFEKIYLLGSDCNYSGSKKHFDDNFDAYIPSHDDQSQKLFRAFSVANDFSKVQKFEIFNATRGGMLEVFNRITLEELELK